MSDTFVRRWCVNCGRPWPTVRWKATRPTIIYPFHHADRATVSPGRRLLWAACAPCRVGIALSVKREASLIPQADATPPKGKCCRCGSREHVHTHKCRCGGCESFLASPPCPKCLANDVRRVWFIPKNGARRIRESCATCGKFRRWAPLVPAIADTIVISRKPLSTTPIPIVEEV